MEKIIKKQDWYESVDSDVDFNEINKTNTISRYTNTINTNLSNVDVKIEESFKNLEEFYLAQEKLNNEQSVTTAETNEEHPIDRFNRIKKEIDLIEKDLDFYKCNKETLDKRISFDRALFELKNLKVVANHLGNSENLNIVQEIKEKNLNFGKDGFNLLNRKIYEKLNEHLLNRLNIINQLRSKKGHELNDMQYELYLTPDIQKVKLYTKLLDIKKKMVYLESKIGNWDIKTKRRSISEVVMNTNNHLRFFDKDFQIELEKKLDLLNTRLKDINESKEEFFHIIKKDLLDDLFNTIGSSRQIEDVIFKSVSKMESLKQSHEDSAYIHLKIKELSSQQDSIGIGIDQNLNILDDINKNVKQNISDMSKNIEFVKQRILKLKERK